MANELLKKAMIEAMAANFGVVTTAAKAAGVVRQSHYDWMNEDPEYKQAIFDLKEIKKDFIESKLLQLVADKDVAATIFSAKTQLKDRGYIERQEIAPVDQDGNTLPVIMINVINPKGIENNSIT